MKNSSKSSQLSCISAKKATKEGRITKSKVGLNKEKAIPTCWNTPKEQQKESLGLVVGVDISKGYFDGCINGKVHRFSQDEVGFKAFYGCLLGESQVVLESTGGYQYALCYYLLDKGIKVSVVNPHHARNYGKSQGLKAKTDKIDAKMLTSFGNNQIQEGKLKQWEKPNNESVKVEHLLNLSQLLKDRIVQSKQKLACWQLYPCDNKVSSDLLQKMIENDEETLKSVEIEIDKFVQEHEEEAQLLTSIPGIGKQSVKFLLLLLCCGKKFTNANELAAYIGTDPNVGTSGTSVKQAGYIRKEGYRQLRTLLYMCALSAKRYNKACKDLYDRLLAKGKKKKVALIAVVNKLLKQIFAIYTTKTKYDQNHLSENKSIKTTNISMIL